MGADDPLKGTLYDLMTWSENFRFNPNDVDRSLPKVIAYMLLAESSTRKLHVTIFLR